MALNLSTLTSSATSGDVLAEALTTADFLENVPVLRNLARGSQKGGDAKQDVALNQPKALPLIKNPAGDLGGYLYIPDVAGNYATGPSVTIGSNQTWEGELDVVITQFGNYFMPMGGGDWTAGFGLLLYSGGNIRVFSKSAVGASNPSGITLGTPLNIKYGFGAIGLYVKINDEIVSQTTASQSSSITHTLELNQQAALPNQGNYAIQKAKLTVNNAVVFDCDFNGSTSIRHGDTKFQAAVGGPVTVNQSGNDPATVIKKSVLRFDGVTNGLKGLFDQTIDGGYMFAAFTVLGSGGDSWGRVFTVNKTGGFDFNTTGNIFSAQESTSGDLAYASVTGNVTSHPDLFDDENGDILHQVKITNSAQSSLVNGVDFQSKTASLTLEAQEFNIGKDEGTTENAALDLEFLALFPASITDAQADSVRNYINNRNNVFSLIDSQGYYFYDAQKAPVGAITTGSSSWNGRIVGSDFGDSDRYATQGTTNDAPVGDGFKVTFADNTDHLDIPQVTQAGWQVVGTRLGTFAYRVNANAVTELNLLGNLGSASYRKAGDLYGIILLPESATGKDIEDARKLLIDRGASDGASGSFFAAWYTRQDIVEFKPVDMSNVTNVQSAWNNTSLTDFPALDLSSSTSFYSAWRSCSNLVTMGAINAENGTQFTNAWKSCSALTSFPAGAKLGTSRSNVNFTDAWRASGLTSFSTPLPTATNLSNAFLGCSSLTTFSTALPKAEALGYSWYNCSSLTDFSADVFSNWSPSSIGSGIFNLTWDGCTSLTAQSVENILVSIDASGKYATSTGASGGSALADAGIDIDYNVATGSLSAATNSAIDSLSGKGWEVYINGVLVIPNILDLEPAAAYSLRSFDSAADPNVVNVRRSSDNATSDFTASEVSDGTLRDWTLGDTLALENNRMYFDGVNDKVDVSGVDIGSYSEITIKTRVLWNDGVDTNEGIFTNNNTAAGRFSLNISGNTLFVVVDSGTNSETRSQTIQTGRYYNIVASAKLDGTTLKLNLFVDGVETGELSVSSTQTDFNHITQNWVIGYLNNARYFEGLIDYVDVYEGYSTDGSVTGMTQLHGWSNTNITDASWTDSVGSANGTVSGTPALFSGQGFDGHVTTWYDQGGTNHAAQATASSQPKIVDGGTLVTEGGEPALDFDGAGDHLFNDSVAALFTGNDQPLSMFACANSNSSTTSADVVSLSSSTSYTPLKRLLLQNKYPQFHQRDDSGTLVPLNSPTSISTQNVLSVTTTASNHQFYSQGNLIASDTTDYGDVTVDLFTIGLLRRASSTAYPMSGTIQEILLFDSYQSTNRQGIDNNIMTYYGIE